MSTPEHHGFALRFDPRVEPSWIKRELLLFDKVAILQLDHALRDPSSHNAPDKSTNTETLEFLRDCGVVYSFEAPRSSTHPDVRAYISSTQEKQRLALSIMRSIAEDSYFSADDDEWLWRTWEEGEVHEVRAAVAEAQHAGRHVASSILPSSTFHQEADFVRSHRALRVIVHSLPVPDEIVSLEDILSLRSDPEFVLHRAKLRAWLRKVETFDWSDAEILEEIRHLSHEYNNFMRLQKIKCGVGRVTALVKFGVGVLEDVVKLRLRDVVDAAATFTGENVNLALAEATAPGRELALLTYLDRRLG